MARGRRCAAPAPRRASLVNSGAAVGLFVQFSAMFSLVSFGLKREFVWWEGFAMLKKFLVRCRPSAGTAAPRRAAPNGDARQGATVRRTADLGAYWRPTLSA